jgi:hypothetical protein
MLPTVRGNSNDLHLRLRFVLEKTVMRVRTSYGVAESGIVDETTGAEAGVTNAATAGR